jgi:hypothetical protein
VNRQKVHEAKYTKEQAKEWWAKNGDKLKKVWNAHPDFKESVQNGSDLNVEKVQKMLKNNGINFDASVGSLTDMVKEFKQNM